MKPRICSRAGFTLIEVLIALFLTGVLSIAAFRFYGDMHNHAITQEEISDMQQNSRVTLQELFHTLRMAGYKIGSHAPYRIQGDSLWVFFSDSLPVDTILYYLADAPSVGGQEAPWRQLMRKRNSHEPELFAEQINALSYRQVNSSTVEITLEVQTSKADETFVQDDGYRTIELVERVHLRNVKY